VARRLCAWWLGLALAGHALAGVPGVGIVIDAISDEFEAPFSFDHQANISSNGLWYGQFRGAPEIVQLVAPPDGATAESASALRLRSIDNGDDPNPGMEDFVANFYDATLFGRFLEFSEEPSFVTYAYFPPVSQWPQTAEGSNCFGFRVAAWDDTLVSPSNPHGEYYPSIWAFRGSDGKGYLNARVGDGFIPDVLIAEITSTGWFTLGISWDAEGRIEYYAAAGRRELTAGDLIYTDIYSARRLDVVPYHFFSLRFPATGNTSPDFLVDRCRVFTRRLPAIPKIRTLTSTGASHEMSIDGTTPGFAYRVQRTGNLVTGSWQEIERFVSDGLSHVFTDTPGGTKIFYRAGRNADTPAPETLLLLQATPTKAKAKKGPIKKTAPKKVGSKKQRAKEKLQAQPTWK